MVYYGTYTTEGIAIHPIGDPENMCFIELTKVADVPMFVVSCSHNKEWHHEFYIDNNSDYERVKMAIMEVAFDANSIDEVLNELTEIFKDGFDGILAKDEHECNCGKCTYMN